jgi:hypothetical protein
VLTLTAFGALISSCRSHPEGAEAASAFLDLRGQTLCTMNFRCCMPAQQQQASQEECEQRSSLHTGFRELTEAVDEGTTSIDMARAESCFAEVRAMTCAAWSAALAGAVPASCSGIFSGRANGQGCTKDAQCSSQFCDRTSGDHTILVPQAAGICASPVGPGGSCPADQYGCLPGSRCLGPNGVPTCTAFPATGAACSRDTDCVSVSCASGACAQACWASPTVHHLLGTPGR